MVLSAVERSVVSAPWARIPTLRRRGRWRRLLWVAYLVAFLGVFYGPLALEAARAMFGTVPRRDAAAVVGWLIGGLVVVAVGSGTAGGPWWFRSGTAAWTLPSRVGPAIIRRATLGLFASVAIVGAAAGAVLVLALDATEVDPLTRLVHGAASASALAVAATALAVVVQPLTNTGFLLALCLIVAGAACAVVTWAVEDGAPVVAVAAAGSVPDAALLWAELVIALGGLVAAVVVASVARVERLDARARSLRTLPVILFHQDLRSLMALRIRLSGEQPRDTPRVAWADPLRMAVRWPVLRRHLDSLRRSPRRRLVRIGLLIGLITWGWWLVWLRSPVLGVTTVALGSWFVALDMAEPLGQERDRPMLSPRPTLRHRLGHVAASAVPTAILLALPAAVLHLALDGTDVRRATLALGPGVIVTSVAGAAHTLLRPDVEFNAAALVAPEAYGAAVVLRELRPPVIVAIGLLPLVSHDRWLASDGASGGSAVRNVAVAMVVLAAVLGTAAWQEHRADRRREAR